MNAFYQALLPSVLAVADAAAAVLKTAYSHKNYKIQSKPDDSPVTEADMHAHQILEEGLYRLDPSLPFISEEGEPVPFELRSQWSRYWLVDPLDGTREFIQKTGEFSVNIALIENHQPVLGVVVAPILEQAYWAVQGGSAFLRDSLGFVHPIKVYTGHRLPLKVLVSRRFNQSKSSAWQTLEKHLGEYQLEYFGSALKICWVAKGAADLYPRFGLTGEWDTAAGQCILEAAGGQLIDAKGKPLEYNRRTTLENPEFYAIGAAHLAALCCG